MSFRIDGQCPGCDLAFNVNITPMYVHDGAAMSVEEAIAAGVIKEWPASLREKRQPFVPTVPSEEAVPLPPADLDEPEDLDNTSIPVATIRAAANHQANTQDAKRRRAADGKICPRHHRAKPSQFGGLYCSSADNDAPSGWCRWTSRHAENEEAA